MGRETDEQTEQNQNGENPNEELDSSKSSLENFIFSEEPRPFIYIVAWAIIILITIIYSLIDSDNLLEKSLNLTTSLQEQYESNKDHVSNLNKFIFALCILILTLQSAMKYKIQFIRAISFTGLAVNIGVIVQIIINEAKPSDFFGFQSYESRLHDLKKCYCLNGCTN